MKTFEAVRSSRIAALKTGVAVAGIALSLAMPGAALAADEDEDKEAIVVTGTLLRVEAPVGSNALTLGEQKLEETAAISSNELLASIPQVTNYFNRVPIADLYGGTGGAVNQIQISRPNLRNISGNNSASSATLILVDGHRVATAGVNQASVDPDLIPTGAIERVEVVTEGGSSIYGADAVAGVINFITRKRFNGVEVGGHYGFADDYWQWDANATLGKDWGSGSAYVSYTYTKSDSLYGRDRGFIRNLDYSAIPYVGRDLECENANLLVNSVAFGTTISSNPYAAPDFVQGTSNRCDNSQNATYIPKAERHGVVAGLTQEFGSSTSIDVRAYWSRRETRGSADLTGTVPVGAANPWVGPALPSGLVLGPVILFGFLPAENIAAVSFNLRPALGPDAGYANTFIEQWGANAEIKHDINDNWQARVLFNWGQSDSSYGLSGISNSRLAAAGVATTFDTAFNPFDVTMNNPALLADLIDSEIAGQAKDTLFNARAIVEGKLLELPGGDVRLAVGYEYMHDKLKQRFQSDIRIGTLGTFPFTGYSRDVHSIFGELQLPLIADGNGGSMFTVSASARYDDYSDFGSTFNPKIGATFRPANWITIRGNWGTSFTAPTPLDQLGSLRNTISSFPFVPFAKPGEDAPGGAWTIAIQGSNPGLQPQEADTWSLGVDLTPVRRLRASVNYYNVKFNNILGTPTPNSGIFANFPNNVATSLGGFTPTELRAFGALVPGGGPVVESLISSGVLVYEFVDFRVGNYGILKVDGIDFSVNYVFDTFFGSMDVAVNGNRPLTRKRAASPTSPIANDLATENPKLFLQASVGANVGAVRAQVTWSHTGGYDIPPTTGVPVQSRVGAFNTVDMFFKYDVPGESAILKDLSFTLNIKNLFDTDPPILRRNNPAETGFANGFTFGRMFILGVNKKFGGAR